MTLATDLAGFVSALDWALVPGHARDSARDRVLDALSTAVASRETAVTRSALIAQSAVGHGEGPASILPTGGTTSIDGAAFVNGVAVHAVLYEDINMSSADHPGAVIVPAALAAAEGAATVLGRAATVDDLLIGVLAGYEVHLWLGRIAAAGVMSRGFRTTSVFGSVAAAATTAKVLRLPPDEVVRSVAFGANAAFGFLEGFRHGTAEPYLQAGFAARTGVHAALVAHAGGDITDAALDGPAGYLHGFADVDHPIDGGHEEWLIGGVSTKPYPISGGKISAVDSALALQRAGLGATIDGVTVLTPFGTAAFPGADRPGPYETMYQAQDSIQYCVAAALLGKPIWSLDYVMHDFAEPEVDELSHLIEVVGEHDRDLTAVIVRLSDGRTLHSEVDWSEKQVPTVLGMSRKLAELTAGAWPDGTAEAVSALLVDGGSEPIGALSRLLRG